MVYQIRPYEVAPGATGQAIKEVVDRLSDFLENRKRYEILERTPGWISERLAQNKKLKDTFNTLGKVSITSTARPSSKLCTSHVSA